MSISIDNLQELIQKGGDYDNLKQKYDKLLKKYKKIKTIISEEDDEEVGEKTSNLLDIKQMLWSEDKEEVLKDYKGDVYKFGEKWKNNIHISMIYKNGDILHEEGGYQRAYLMWLDDKDIIHFAHGHQNINKISHCYVTDDPVDKGWGCSWTKMDDIMKQLIYDHFNVSI